MGSNGNFFIAWEDDRDEYASNIYAQRYSNTGNKISGNFQVNDDAGSAWQTDPATAVTTAAT